MKTHQFVKKTIITSDGKPFDIWVTYALKAWLNATIMTKWLEIVYIPHLQATGQEISKSVLFLDNCSAHRTEECLRSSRRLVSAMNSSPSLHPHPPAPRSDGEPRVHAGV